MAVNLNKDTFYRAAKAKEKDCTINGGGLFLFVGVGGSSIGLKGSVRKSLLEPIQRPA